MAKKDYYEALGVSKSASQDDIKKAFRKLAREHHPDKKGGDDTRFKEISEAYDTLSDERKRREYDAGGRSFGGQDFSGFQGGFDFSQFSDMTGFDLNDLFEQFGGGSPFGTPRKARGRDISIELDVPFRDAIFGTERSMLLRKQSECHTCAGSSAKPGTEQKTCTTCGGAGKVHETRQTMMGTFSVSRSCGTCAGRGKVPKEACTTCSGKGVVLKEEEVRVHVPPGMDDGSVIRMPGRGEAISGGSPGDLYAKVRVKNDTPFRKEGVHLVTDVPIRLADALLGTTHTVTTLEGKTLEVKIPAMEKTEELLRVKGQGVPQGSGRGDLLLKVSVVLPKKLSQKAKRAIEELKEEGV